MMGPDGEQGATTDADEFEARGGGGNPFGGGGCGFHSGDSSRHRRARAGANIIGSRERQ
jgi:hypothetical protein